MNFDMSMATESEQDRPSQSIPHPPPGLEERQEPFRWGLRPGAHPPLHTPKVTHDKPGNFLFFKSWHNQLILVPQASSC